MSNRKLLTFAVVAFIPLALLVMLVALTSNSSNPPQKRKSADTVIFVPAHLEPPTTYQPINTSEPPAPVFKPLAFATLPDPKAVQDADLKHLAAMVNLASAKKSPPSTEEWSQALSIAKKLAAGTCDCEQRNWLNQFITMGNYALSGSSQYYESARLMDTLPLNDTNLALRYYSN